MQSNQSNAPPTPMEDAQLRDHLGMYGWTASGPSPFARRGKKGGELPSPRGPKPSNLPPSPGRASAFFLHATSMLYKILLGLPGAVEEVVCIVRAVRKWYQDEGADNEVDCTFLSYKA